MLDQHRELIKRIIDLDPHSINMYWGYKGDKVLKLETASASVADEMGSIAEGLGLEIATKYDGFSTKLFTVFCIAKDEDVYDLK